MLLYLPGHSSMEPPGGPPLSYVGMEESLTGGIDVPKGTTPDVIAYTCTEPGKTKPNKSVSTTTTYSNLKPYKRNRIQTAATALSVSFRSYFDSSTDRRSKYDDQQKKKDKQARQTTKASHADHRAKGKSNRQGWERGERTYVFFSSLVLRLSDTPPTKTKEKDAKANPGYTFKKEDDDDEESANRWIPFIEGDSKSLYDVEDKEKLIVKTIRRRGSQRQKKRKAQEGKSTRFHASQS